MIDAAEVDRINRMDVSSANDLDAVKCRGYLYKSGRRDFDAWWQEQKRARGPVAWVEPRRRYATVTCDLLNAPLIRDVHARLVDPVLRWAAAPPTDRSALTMTVGPGEYISCNRAPIARACIAAQALVELWAGQHDTALALLAGRPFAPFVVGLPKPVAAEVAELGRTGAAPLLDAEAQREWAESARRVRTTTDCHDEQETP